MEIRIHRTYVYAITISDVWSAYVELRVYSRFKIDEILYVMLIVSS